MWHGSISQFHVHCVLSLLKNENLDVQIRQQYGAFWAAACFARLWMCITLHLDWEPLDQIWSIISFSRLFMQIVWWFLHQHPDFQTMYEVGDWLVSASLNLDRFAILFSHHNFPYNLQSCLSTICLRQWQLLIQITYNRNEWPVWTTQKCFYWWYYCWLMMDLSQKTCGQDVI